MTSIYLLRHGESEMNVQAADVVGGRSNHTPLTNWGKEQALLAGRWLLAHDIVPDVVVASPALRTLHTTVLALDGMNMSGRKFDIDYRLQELSQGIMEGRARSEVWTPDVVTILRQDPMQFKFEKGDSVADVQSRKIQWLETVEKAHPKGTVLVGAHGLAIRALVGAIEGWDHKKIIHDTPTPNCSLTLIESTDGQRTVQYVGRDIIAEQLAIEAQKV